MSGLFCFQFFSDARLDAAGFIFFDDIGLCRFIHCLIKAGKEFLCVNLPTCEGKLFDVFKDFFIRIGLRKISRMSAAGLPEGFDS